MNYEQYSPLAIRTAKRISVEMDLAHAYMGIITEVGEITDAFKKHQMYGKALDLVNLKEELGDAFWYLNLLWTITGKGPTQSNWSRFLAPTTYTEMQNFLFGLARDAASVACQLQSATAVQCKLEQLCAWHGITLGDCLRTNIEKLAARYGDKYTDYAALNRNLAAERNVLEQP